MTTTTTPTISVEFDDVILTVTDPAVLDADLRAATNETVARILDGWPVQFAYSAAPRRHRTPIARQPGQACDAYDGDARTRCT